jgi:hypothetical protein
MVANIVVRHLLSASLILDCASLIVAIAHLLLLLLLLLITASPQFTWWITSTVSCSSLL